MSAGLAEVKAQLAQLFALVGDNVAAPSQRQDPAAAPKAPGRVAGDDAGDPPDDPDQFIDDISLAGSSEVDDSLLGGLGDGRPGGGRVAGRGARHAHIVLHPEGFDDPDLPDVHDIIRAYDIPAAVRRRDGIPMPFEPDDARFHAHIKHGAASYHEASFAYQAAAWAQELSNAAVMLYHERKEFSAAGLADRLAGPAMASRQLLHLSTAHYDFLEYRQRDPVGAQLYKSTEVVPRSTFRGPKG